LAFENVIIDQPLTNLIGELSVVLRVPLLQSNLVNFDLPYTVVPQKRPLLNVYTCDNESGVVEQPGGQKVWYAFWYQILVKKFYPISIVFQYFCTLV